PWTHPSGWVVTACLKEFLPLLHGPEISATIHRFSFSPAATLTTYAAAGFSVAGASVVAAFGGCGAMAARRAGTPPLLFTTPMTVTATSDIGDTLCGLSSQTSTA